MIDRARSVVPVPPVDAVTAPRRVHSNFEKEQFELYERAFANGHPIAVAPPSEPVTTLTQGEIERIEEHLPEGATVASILGRPLEFHVEGEHRHAQHLPTVDGHVDVDA